MGANRLRGDGWEAWRDGDIVHTRATDAQHGVSAGARTEALAALLREGGKAVLADERRAGPPSPAAVDAYSAFARTHRIPIAIVARDHGARPSIEAVRSAVSAASIMAFPEPRAAMAWLRAELARRWGRVADNANRGPGGATGPGGVPFRPPSPAASVIPRRAHEPSMPARPTGRTWDVWLDDEGFVWTRDYAPQDAAAAGERAAAIEARLAEGARGVVVDDTAPHGPSSPGAVAVYTRLVRAHPDVRFAVVSTDPDTFREAFSIRHDAHCANLEVFRTMGVAKAWLRMGSMHAVT